MITVKLYNSNQNRFQNDQKQRLLKQNIQLTLLKSFIKSIVNLFKSKKAEKARLKRYFSPLF